MSTKKQCYKRLMGACFFCGDQDYELLDAHRIVFGEDGGKYIKENMLCVCCKCHRKIHGSSKDIVIDRKYPYTGAGFIVHYWENGEEKWKPELRAENIISSYKY